MICNQPSQARGAHPGISCGNQLMQRLLHLLLAPSSPTPGDVEPQEHPASKLLQAFRYPHLRKEIAQLGASEISVLTDGI